MMKQGKVASKFLKTLSISGLLATLLSPVSYAASLQLKVGDSGTQVKEAEQMLHTLGYYVLVDTYYDAYTQRAVSKFQTKYNLKATGVLDQQTYHQLKMTVDAINATIGKPAPTPTPTPASAPTPGANASISAEEKQMLDLVNQERVQRGLAPLKLNEKLMELARLKAKDMVEKGYFSHQSPTYGDPFTMMRNAGVTFKLAGENLAGNWSVQSAHTSLMNSPGHRANILNSSYNQVGIGIIPGSQYGNIFVQMFIQQ